MDIPPVRFPALGMWSGLQSIARCSDDSGKAGTRGTLIALQLRCFYPGGLAIHLAMNHNTTEYSDSYLENTLIGRLSADM